MILRRIKYFFTKNPLDLIDPVAIKDEKIRLESEIESLHRTILAQEKVIDEYWNKAKETKSPADEQVLAQRINTLLIRKNAILKKISSKESRLHTVEEFINKIEEKKQKSSLAPLIGSELEAILEQIRVIEEGKTQTEKTLSGISESDNVEMDEGVADVLQAIKATKTSDTYKIAPEKEQGVPKQKSSEFET